MREKGPICFSNRKIFLPAGVPQRAIQKGLGVSPVTVSSCGRDPEGLCRLGHTLFMCAPSELRKAVGHVQRAMALEPDRMWLGILRTVVDGSYSAPA